MPTTRQGEAVVGMATRSEGGPDPDFHAQSGGVFWSVFVLRANALIHDVIIHELHVSWQVWAS